jgi:UDP-N-acetylmuramate-alanine ligase
MNNIQKLLIINGDDDFLFLHKTKHTISMGFKDRNNIQIKKITNSSFLFQRRLITMSPHLEGEQYMFNYASAIYFYEYFLDAQCIDFLEMMGIKNRMEIYRDSKNNILYLIDNGHQPISMGKTINYIVEKYKDYKKILYFWPKPYYFHHDSYESCFQFIDQLIIIHNEKFFQHVKLFYPNVSYITEFKENELEKNSIIIFGGLCYINHAIQEFLKKTLNF